MPNFALDIRQDPNKQQDPEVLTQMIGLALLPRARSLWEEWLDQGQLIEVDGCWRWKDEPPSPSDADSASNQGGDSPRLQAVLPTHVPRAAKRSSPELDIWRYLVYNVYTL